MNWDWVSARSSSADVAEEAQWLHDAEMADIDGAVAIKGVAELVKDLDTASRVIVTSAPADLAAARQATIGLWLAATMVTAGDISKGSRIRTASSRQMICFAFQLQIVSYSKNRPPARRPHEQRVRTSQSSAILFKPETSSSPSPATYDLATKLRGNVFVDRSGPCVPSISAFGAPFEAAGTWLIHKIVARIS